MDTKRLRKEERRETETIFNHCEVESEEELKSVSRSMEE